MQFRLASIACALLLTTGAIAAAVGGAPAQGDAVNVWQRATLTPANVTAAIEAEIKKVAPIIAADRAALLKVLSSPLSTPAQIAAAYQKLGKDLAAAQPAIQKLLQQAVKVGLTQTDIAKILKNVAPELKKLFQLFQLPSVSIKLPRATATIKVPTPSSVIAAIEAEIKKLAPIIAADQAAIVKLLGNPLATAAEVQAAFKKLQADLAAAQPTIAKLLKQAQLVGLTPAQISKILKNVAPEIKKLFGSLLPSASVTIKNIPRATSTVTVTVPSPVEVQKAIFAALTKATATLLKQQAQLTALLLNPATPAKVIKAAQDEIKKTLAGLAPVLKKLADQAKAAGLTQAQILKAFAGFDAGLLKAFLKFFEA